MYHFIGRENFICSYSWPWAQLLLLVSMSRAGGLFQLFSKFEVFYFMCMLHGLKLVEMSSLFPWCIVFLSDWRSFSCTRAHFLKFNLWSMSFVCWHLKRGRRKFIYLDKTAFRKLYDLVGRRIMMGRTSCIFVLHNQQWWSKLKCSLKFTTLRYLSTLEAEERCYNLNVFIITINISLTC